MDLGSIMMGIWGHHDGGLGWLPVLQKTAKRPSKTYSSVFVYLCFRALVFSCSRASAYPCLRVTVYPRIRVYMGIRSPVHPFRRFAANRRRVGGLAGSQGVGHRSNGHQRHLIVGADRHAQVQRGHIHIRRTQGTRWKRSCSCDRRYERRTWRP